MWSRRHRRARWLALAPVVAAALIVVLSGQTTPAAHSDGSHSYLALGDSVAFGFITHAGYEYTNPANFVGYPQWVGEDLHLDTVNAACPGEATGGFISAAADDNGCREYRAGAPLHVAYSGTQLSFAVSYLVAHPSTRLVTIGLGANDVFLLERRCGNDIGCALRRFPAAMATVTARLDTILQALRGTRFHGVLVVVNYYSPDYADQATTTGTRLLDDALAASARSHGAVVADVYTAFRTVAEQRAGGRTCNAGLLDAEPGNQFTCDYHPSQSGQRLIAAVVEQAYARATGSPAPAALPA
jgi:lysophospholipase L1-like esterase